MADQKISQLTSYTTPLSADVLPIVDTANTTTKKISWSALLTALTSGLTGFLTTSVYDPAAIAQQVVGTTATQTLSNKTLTTPVIGAATGTSLSLAGDLTAHNLIPSASATYAVGGSAATYTNVYTQSINTGALNGNTTVFQARNVGGSSYTTFATLTANTSTPTFDLAIATTVGGASIVSTTGSQTLTNKTLTTPIISSISNTGTLTLPTATDTLVGRATTDTLTNKTLTAPVITTVAETGVGTADLLAPNNHTVTVTSNAGTASQSFLVNTFTNSSAATMAITLGVSTPTPKDGQFMVVRVYDFSGVAETIGWTNTENSTVSVPTTSNGSTTLPLSVCFMYNAATSKWRCVASA